MRPTQLALTLMLLALTRCADPLNEVRGLHEECVVCTSGSMFACTETTELACEPGLYCATASFRSCEPYAQLGDFCSFQYLCEPGLVCGHSETCEAPLTAGATCDARSFCIEGTTCNGGGVPDDPKAGTCLAPGAPAGAPCAWSAGPRGFSARGCADGLVCQPRSAFDPAHDVAATDGCCAVCTQAGSDTGAGDLGDCLGWPGVCKAPATGARGDACTSDAACASGKCVVLPPPRLGPDVDPPALTAPWPGVCGGLDDPIGDTVCTANGGCDLACATHADCLPGTLCNPQSRRCVAQYQGTRDAFCGQRQVLASLADDRFCAVGLACDVDARRCRDAGPGGLGDPCANTTECAAGFICDETCVPHGQLGDVCDFMRRCDFDLRCSVTTARCEAPGPVDQGGACQDDAACGKGLACETARQTCQWLSFLGEPCERCEPGLRCELSGEGLLGTCVAE